ncbi:ABC transporter ATP-binding protein [Paenibacillus sp. GSMTC-2017]|uniref:ABC transporter ATP-binding protein n=1 Tax=Paenibacillus sp. GSMTC-2017 TaxID=2794350 RepID=UPI0018D601F6|nr:ABC transporter ATP-binding protein [Paenibacillus sp. GSMTC-2017]MBH5317447.1 ABC transporter ATP-binding protein [Paenibacillus sp. GSMTC-2017]
MTYVSLTNMTYAYPGSSSDVIKNFSLELNKGEVVGLLGQSGSGKSTLLRLIAGLEMPKEGTLNINGTTMVSDYQYVPPERRGVGMVFQDYALFPHMTVAQNIAFGLHGMSRVDRNNRVSEMLALVKLEEYGKRYSHELSGGQQQRVAFARALAPKPMLLLMDEPFSNLDADLKVSIREELRELLRISGITSILVTHDQEDADAICDRIIRMPSLVLA